MEYHKLGNSSEGVGGRVFRMEAQRRPLNWRRKCRWVWDGQQTSFSPGFAVAFADYGR